MNLLKISRGALEVREANSPLTEGELHLNTVFNKNTIDTLDELVRSRLFHCILK